MMAHKTSRLRARNLRYHLANIDPSRSSPQLQSPLFRIPAEIRNLIYRFAFQGSQSYSECRYCGSKSHDSLQKGVERIPLVDISLLQTCRIVYSEASGMPLRLTILHSCLGSLTRLRDRVQRLTARNVLDLTEVHLNGLNLDDLLNRLRGFSRLAQFQPTRLTLRAESDDPAHWRSRLTCGLIVQGTVPLSLQVLSIQLKSRNIDIQCWNNHVEALQPLELDLGCGQKLSQRRRASVTVDETPKSDGTSSKKPFALFVLQLDVNSESHDENLPIHKRSSSKVAPHLNQISCVRQILKTKT